GWYCPIKEVRGDNAYYSISRDEVVLPQRSQFKDMEAFQTNLFHECAHSSGSENRLGRLKPGSTFGSKEYAREELVAELTAAFVSANYGMTKGLKSDSAPYLKSWLDSLHETPDFIKKVLLDVKRASSMLIMRIDAINERIEQGLPPVDSSWYDDEQPLLVDDSVQEIAAKMIF
ncbi:MAG: DNA primase, partial [Bacteroidaceae bacterium]|nr:DNA primase [Bacteroidaceae bacterium]